MAGLTWITYMYDVYMYLQLVPNTQLFLTPHLRQTIGERSQPRFTGADGRSTYFSLEFQVVLEAPGLK
jgi:hypothetical protein